MPYLFHSILSFILSYHSCCNQLSGVGRACKDMWGTWCPWGKAYRSWMGWLCSRFGEREHCPTVYPQFEGQSSSGPNGNFSIHCWNKQQLTSSTIWFGMCIRKASTNQGLRKGSLTRMILGSMFLLPSRQVVLPFSSFSMHLLFTLLLFFGRNSVIYVKTNQFKIFPPSSFGIGPLIN